MIAGFFATVGAALIEPTARCDVGFVADHWVDAFGLAGFVKLECTVEIAVVGERQGVHAEFFGPTHELFDWACSVEQTEMAMAMQMNKRRRQGGSLPTRCGSNSS